jgi:hypothetical protein
MPIVAMMAPAAPRRCAREPICAQVAQNHSSVKANQVKVMPRAKAR